MNAIVKSDMIILRASYVLDAELVVEVDCYDFDNYKSLPQVIEVQGKNLGKTGWSSDRHYACYKEKVLLGKVIDFYA